MRIWNDEDIIFIVFCGYVVTIFPIVYSAAMPGWINVIPNAHILQLSSILRNLSSLTPTILPRTFIM